MAPERKNKLGTHFKKLGLLTLLIVGFNSALSFSQMEPNSETAPGKTKKEPAQARKGSGSSNGSGNRDTLSYSQELEPSLDDEKNLEESIESFVQTLKKLYLTQFDYLPAGNDSFWEDFSKEDALHIQNTDKALNNLLKYSEGIFQSFRPVFLHEIGLIKKYKLKADESTTNEERKGWKEKSDRTREELKYLTRAIISESLLSLYFFPSAERLSAIEVSDIFEAQHPTYPSLTGQILSLNYAKCSSYKCAKLLHDRFISHEVLMLKLKDMTISIPEIHPSIRLEKIQDFDDFFNLIRPKNQSQYQKAVMDINEREIRRNLNVK
jgi:hypothetical protein